MSSITGVRLGGDTMAGQAEFLKERRVRDRISANQLHSVRES
jgi:hypothetical protein